MIIVLNPINLLSRYILAAPMHMTRIDFGIDPYQLPSVHYVLRVLEHIDNITTLLAKHNRQPRGAALTRGIAGCQSRFACFTSESLGQDDDGEQPSRRSLEALALGHGLLLTLSRMVV